MTADGERNGTTEKSCVGLRRRPAGWRRILLGAALSGGLLMTVRPGDTSLAAQARMPPAPLQRQAPRTTHVPISFEKNMGQTNRRVAYLARGSGSTLFFTPSEAVLTLTSSPAQTHRSGGGAVLHFRYLHANPHPHMVGLDRLPGVVNYFLGNDPARWHTNIPTYARIEYQNVYPGIDLVYYGRNGRVEYDWVVRPDADVTRIGLGIEGAYHLRLNRQGQLVIRTGMGEVVQPQPLIYQERAGTRLRISGAFRWDHGGGLAIRLAQYDRSRALVIDPTVPYSSYLGGSDYDYGTGIAVDSAGNAYVTGDTHSIDFPTSSPFQAQSANKGNAYNAFVTKIDASGGGKVYSTYLGGSMDDHGAGIALDSSGNAYITGSTSSPDFPTVAPFQASNVGNGSGVDAFVAKLNATGSALLYSSYLGGGSIDHGYAIAVDGARNAYVTGTTISSDFPTTAASFQVNPGGNSDAFVTKINASGSALVYSTYLGGSGYDHGKGIAVDGAGNAYVTGDTSSADFPTVAPFQASYAGSGGSYNAFVTKVNASGNALVYSSYLGGSVADYGYGIAIDRDGNAYVTGRTESTDFPTTAPFQASRGGLVAGFVTKINASGSAKVYSSYLGGGEGRGIALDSAANAYVTGVAYPPRFPDGRGFPDKLRGRQY